MSAEAVGTTIARLKLNGFTYNSVKSLPNKSELQPNKCNFLRSSTPNEWAALKQHSCFKCTATVLPLVNRPSKAYKSDPGFNSNDIFVLKETDTEWENVSFYSILGQA